MSARASLAAALTQLLHGWRVVPGIAAPERITKHTIVLEQARVAPSDGAAGLYEYGVSVHVITPLSGVTAAAEDDIDAVVLTVIAALESIPNVSCGAATKKVYRDQNLSYEIETTLLMRKKTTP